MDFFEKYSSNTVGGSGNQSVFYPTDKNSLNVGRVFFKLTNGGKYNYSFLFTNIIDSTYADGKISHSNLVCDEWFIESMKVGICTECSVDKMPDVELASVTFGGKEAKRVSPGEFFYTDETELSAKKGDYICIEIAFRGRMIPHHPESILPAFVLSDGEWKPSRLFPFPSMIGCDRKVKSRIAYLGDSITQGIGVAFNSYAHWNALLSDMLPSENAYWNLGLGYARAYDAASNGAWLFKVKQNDIATVCLGVNDITKGRSAEDIINSLTVIYDALSKSGVKVIFQTVPPFNYNERQREVFFAVNGYIKNEMSKKCPVFDNVPVLCDGTNGEYAAKYGPHPNEEGSRIWADAFYSFLKDIL